MKITTSRADVIWNYVGTIVSMSSGFILLPLLLAFLTPDELGLWYVFLAISNLTQLFEWGFEPTFARNIVYVLSGARKLTPEGCDADSVKEDVDWHLLSVVFKASKVIFCTHSRRFNRRCSNSGDSVHCLYIGWYDWYGALGGMGHLYRCYIYEPILSVLRDFFAWYRRRGRREQGGNHRATFPVGGKRCTSIPRLWTRGRSNRISCQRTPYTVFCASLPEEI